MTAWPGCPPPGAARSTELEPKFEKIEPEADKVGEDRFRAVYPAGAKLTSNYIGDVIDQNIDEALKGIDEYFPIDLLMKRALMGRKQARAVH